VRALGRHAGAQADQDQRRAPGPQAAGRPARQQEDQRHRADALQRRRQHPRVRQVRSVADLRLHPDRDRDRADQRTHRRERRQARADQ
jgi:hypothetical protein